MRSEGVGSTVVYFSLLQKSRYRSPGAGGSGVRCEVAAARLLLVLFCLSASEAWLPPRADAQSVTIGTNPIIYAAPTATDYNNGFGEALRVTVTANVSTGHSYDFRVRALSATLGNSKNVNSLQIRTCNTPGTNCTAWQALSTAYHLLGTGLTGNSGYNVEFRVTWNWATDGPFAYSVPVEFSISGNVINAASTAGFQVNVQPVLVLSAAGASVSFPSPTLANFTTGSVDANSNSTLSTRANVPHRVVLRAGTTHFNSNNQLAVIPALDHEWSTNAAGDWSAWTGLASSAATVYSRPAGNHSGSPVSVRHRMLLGWSRSTTGIHTLNLHLEIQQQ
jgi:hypothetical protein